MNEIIDLLIRNPSLIQRELELFHPDKQKAIDQILRKKLGHFFHPPF